MYHKAETIYFGFASFVLAVGLFVVQPSGAPEVAFMQNDIVDQFSVAWQQTIGDQPWFDGVSVVYDGINSFYTQSADATIALIDKPEADQDMIYVFGEVYNIFAKAFDLNYTSSSNLAYDNLPLPPKGPNFMSEEPLYNLIPYKEIVRTIDTSNPGSVAGIIKNENEVVNAADHPWVTIADNATGDLYCLAVYNGTVNKYLGPCSYDQGYR